VDPIRRLISADLPQLRNFWVEHWGSEQMYLHEDVVRYDQVEGFVHGDWTGLLTFLIRGDECEVTSLDSLHEGNGIGSRLIEEMLREAKARKCKRLMLITTNDNLHALGFYQKRGFTLARLYPGAVDESRKLKPSIPLTGQNDIPLHDEIELEILI
jgi:ribosomal protein S18 acetylase RimI-like enzyme